MEIKKHFQRWYKCDENNRIRIANSIANSLGCHFLVRDGQMFDPEAANRLDLSRKPAMGGIYMLRSIGGFTDPENGTTPNYVAASFVHVIPFDFSKPFPELRKVERSKRWKPVA